MTAQPRRSPGVGSRASLNVVPDAIDAQKATPALPDPADLLTAWSPAAVISHGLDIITAAENVLDKVKPYTERRPIREPEKERCRTWVTICRSNLANAEPTVRWPEKIQRRTPPPAPPRMAELHGGGR